MGRGPNLNYLEACGCLPLSFGPLSTILIPTSLYPTKKTAGMHLFRASMMVVDILLPVNVKSNLEI